MERVRQIGEWGAKRVSGGADWEVRSYSSGKGGADWRVGTLEGMWGRLGSEEL